MNLSVDLYNILHIEFFFLLDMAEIRMAKSDWLVRFQVDGKDKQAESVECFKGHLHRFKLISGSKALHTCFHLHHACRINQCLVCNIDRTNCFLQVPGLYRTHTHVKVKIIKLICLISFVFGY